MTEANLPSTIALIGLGLMNGSLGMRLRRMDDPPTVRGTSRSERTRRRALERGAVDEVLPTPREAVEGAELVVIGTPVLVIPLVMEEIAGALAEGAVVTDVGSTKGRIAGEAKRLLPGSARFVGSHPMAGSEKDGIEAADPRLYEQAVVVLTPEAETDPGALAIVRSLWEEMGAIVREMSPEAHDRAVAAVSHLPHIVAAALVSGVAEAADRDPGIWSLAAGGFRDTTRIASSSPSIWRDICLTNKDAISETLGFFRSRLERLENAVTALDPDRIEEEFEAARRMRENVPTRARGAMKGFLDLYVDLSDRPGALAEVTAVLGGKEINIVDIELEHLRVGSISGPLRLSFESDDERERAKGLLEKAGYTPEIP